MEISEIYKLSEQEQTKIGEQLVKALKLKRDTEHKDRYQTTWGTKTPLGVYRTIEGIIELAKKEKGLI